MKSPSRRAAIETEQIEHDTLGRPTRRMLIKGTIGAAVLADSGMGFAAEQGMTTHPEARVYPNPDSDQTIIILGGWTNDGIAIGDMLAPTFGQYANIVAIRYAQTNVDPDELDRIIFDTMEEHGLHNPSFYLNSGAGLYAAPAIRRHANDPESQARFGRTRVVLLHDSPSSEYDLAIGAHIESVSRIDAALKRSRILNLAFGGLMRLALKGGEFRDPSLVSFEGAENHVRGMQRADLITASAQLAAIRDTNLPDGYLSGAADHFVYVHPAAEDEQLVIPDRAHAGWNRICDQKVRDVLDTNAPDGPSHASNTFPRTLDNVFREYLVA